MKELAMTIITEKPQFPKTDTTTDVNPTNMARALCHASFGWLVFPCHKHGKAPLTTHGFKDATTDEKTIRQWWNKWPQANIGIPTGTTTDLVVIDADGPEGIASYESLNLPATLICETGNGRHYYFTAPEDVIPNSQNGAKLGTGIDVRGEGGYVIAPGSVHHTGVVYEWLDDMALIVDLPADAMRKIQALETEKKGEQQASKRPTAPTPIAPPANESAETDSAAMARCWNYVQAMPEAISGSGGHDRAFAVACVLFRLTENNNVAWQVLARFNNEKCQPPWSEKDLAHKWKSAKAEVEAAGELGSMDRPAPGKPVEPGHTPIKPDAQAAGAPLILDPADPLPTAEMFHAKYHTAADGTQLLRHHQGEFFEYRDGCYRSTGADGIRARVYKYTRQAPGFKPTQHKINIIIDALKAHADLDATISAPAWLDGRTDYPAKEMLAHKTGILHLPTKTNLPATPQFFTRSALDYSYDPQAPSPTKWLMFLKSVWPNDQESIDTLQEVFGYLMSEDTSQQKIFLIVGPKRSGKGTIARLFTSLRGDENIVASMLANLSSNFGTAPLIGKPVCIIPDARLGAGPDQAIITERLLSLSGEDTMTIDRKYLSAWTGRPNTRILIMSNETPRINDSSGALASRFIVLETSKSFLGREEHGLDDKLKAELPGILNWAIDGYQRLATQGRFHQPSSAADTIEELEELGSPVGLFVKDCCIVGVGKTIPVAELYQAWREWCNGQGRDYPGTLQSFSRDLKACEPKIKTIRKQSGFARVRFFEGITL